MGSEYESTTFLTESQRHLGLYLRVHLGLIASLFIGYWTFLVKLSSSMPVALVKIPILLIHARKPQQGKTPPVALASSA
jgi:hypothetical protein